MTYSSAKDIVNFGGTLWWLIIRLGKTKLDDEHNYKNSYRNTLFLILIFYLVILITIKITSPDPLYVVNGIIVSKNEYEKYQPSEIKSITNFEGEAATTIYGEQGKNGVQLITLKNTHAKRAYSKKRFH